MNILYILFSFSANIAHTDLVPVLFYFGSVLFSILEAFGHVLKIPDIRFLCAWNSHCEMKLKGTPSYSHM